MEFTPASNTSLLAFLAIVVLVAAAVPAAAWCAYASAPDGGRKAATNATLGVIAWIAVLCGFVGSGMMSDLPLHGLPFFFVPVIVVSLAVGFSPFGGRVAANVPLFALVGFHAFRLPLELVLHAWSDQGTIPDTMTWSGRNYDILSGCIALVAAPLALRSRFVAWVANVVGAILLVNVIRVAVLSSPIPIGWGQEPTLQLALHLPYALIGPVCVGGALAGHVVLTRALLRKAG